MDEKHGLKATILELKRKASALEAEANTLCAGKHARITSNYNGQAFGRSKKALTEKVFPLSGVSFSSSSGVNFWLEGLPLALDPDEIEIID